MVALQPAALRGRGGCWHVVLAAPRTLPSPLHAAPFAPACPHPFPLIRPLGPFGSTRSLGPALHALIHVHIPALVWPCLPPTTPLWPLAAATIIAVCMAAAAAHQPTVTAPIIPRARAPAVRTAGQ